ncbi:hypothetical protein GYMLUDRAFT_175551 [Collybiopsis luxurians FD-317 M1]|uniref:NmrA-like domain-containing protein n=1 Tax=Collybiopsis luxurians FD-317 M1 TaxID=944289 RepID=A0A0D0BZY7_9AGAR|nr:hypothetical protein GYMLUDRAFT_175551 [Collybiopsis luxurians FD-317 M1]
MLILVIGATGAQGRPVISSLLRPQDDGSPSPYSVRALTRDPNNEHARLLASWGVELFKGQIEDAKSIAAALEGCHGVFVNIDTFSVGTQTEIYTGIKLFEQAHRAGIKHFIWSGLDYASKLGGFDPKYDQAVHYHAKAIVGQYLQLQPSSPSGDSLTWSILSTGPYLENLRGPLLGPLPEKENGAVVWSLPLGDGRFPAISVEDIGWWARYMFDHRAETSGQELKVASEMMNIDQLVETFTRVTGIPAIYKRISIEEHLAKNPARCSKPVVKAQPNGYTIGEAYRGLYGIWGGGLLTRDMEWIRRTHPTGYTLESFIKQKGIDGSRDGDFTLLKDSHLHRE